MNGSLLLRQWGGKVPDSSSRGFQAESEGSRGLLVFPPSGERIGSCVAGGRDFQLLKVSWFIFVEKVAAWIMGRRSSWFLEFLPEGAKSTTLQISKHNFKKFFFLSPRYICFDF